jgi:transketolase
MRTAFINQLIVEARKNNKIFLLVGDLGYNVVEPFANEFPDRFLNVGIAEQNMVGVAAGLAMTGYNVYMYSIGNFLTLRCLEQIRNDVAYHEADVKIIAVGGGYAYADAGATHHVTEVLGVLRTIPNMVICSPSDPIETKTITAISAIYNGPMYIQLGKAGEHIFRESMIECNIGDIIPYNKGTTNKSAILVSGSILADVVDSKQTFGYDIYAVPFIKPLNKAHVRMIANTYSSIIVIEEHQKSCGVGSAFIEQVSDLYSEGEIPIFPRIRRIAIDDVFCKVAGTQFYLREINGLQL